MTLQRIFHRLLPGFFRKIDGWLLIHHPVWWRSGIHYVLYLGLLLNALALLVGLLYNSTLGADSIPNMDQMAQWGIALGFMGIILILFWGMELSVTLSLDAMTYRQFLVYGLVGVFSWFCYYGAVVTFVATVVPYIGRLIPDQAFYDDYQFHDTHRYWCGTGDALLFEQDDSIRQRILTSFRRLGLEEPRAVGYCDRLGNAYPESPLREPETDDERARWDSIEAQFRCLVTLTARGDRKSAFRPFAPRESDVLTASLSPVTARLKKKLESVYQAKLFRKGKGRYLSNLFNIPLYVSAGILLSWLAVSIGALIYGRLNFGFISRIARMINLRNLPLYRKIDERLITRHPAIWASQIHALFFRFGFFFAPVVVVITSGIHLGFDLFPAYRLLFYCLGLVLFFAFAIPFFVRAATLSMIATGLNYREFSYKELLLFQFYASLGAAPYFLTAGAFLNGLEADPSWRSLGVIGVGISFFMLSSFWVLVIVIKYLRTQFHTYTAMLFMFGPVFLIAMSSSGPSADLLTVAMFLITVVFFFVLIVFYFLQSHARLARHLAFLTLALAPTGAFAFIFLGSSEWIPIFGLQEAGPFPLMAFGTLLSVLFFFMVAAPPAKVLSERYYAGRQSP